MNNYEVLWAGTGEPLCIRIDDWLVSLEGTSMGFIERDGAVYNLRGQHVGWFHGGVLRDQFGYCLAITDQADDPFHPPLPALQQRPLLQPLCSLYSLRVPPLTGVAAPPPPPRYSWSTRSTADVLGVQQRAAV